MRAGGFRRGPRRVAYSGRFEVVDYDVIPPGGGESDTIARQVVVHPGAVTVAALRDGALTFVRQYRTAVDSAVVELPAGKVDPGESPLGCAARELEEETGLTARTFTELADYLVSPGWSDERMWLFLAEGLGEGRAGPQGAEEVHMEVFTVPLADAVAMVHDGTIRDAKSIVGVLMARDHLATRPT